MYMSDHFHLESSDVETLGKKIPGEKYKGPDRYHYSTLAGLGNLKFDKKYSIDSEDFYNFTPNKRALEDYHFDIYPPIEPNQLKGKVFIGVLKGLKHTVEDNGDFVKFDFEFSYSNESEIKAGISFSYWTMKTLELAKSLVPEEKSIVIKSHQPDITLGYYLKRFKEYVPVVRDQCPSDTIDPPYECDKKTLLKLHPDKNPGCKEDATEKQKVYNNQCYSRGGKKTRKKNHSKKSKGKKKKGPKKTLKRGKKKTKRSRH